MSAVNLSTGEPEQVVVDIVLGRELRSNYSDNGYVGKSFQITKYKPKPGKRYATFAVSEIRLSNSIQAAATARTLEELAAEPKANRDDSVPLSRSVLADDPLALPYDEYRRTRLWRRIRKRILKRDERLCRRCGGSATLVHHRSYADEVLSGNDDGQLISLCEGCHTIIHFDDAGNKRSEEETDHLLTQRDESAEFPSPKIDLRRSVHRQRPAGWPRMTAIQRNAWDREYERQKVIRWGRLGKNPVAIRTILRGYGMDDAAIDAAISHKTKSKA